MSDISSFSLDGLFIFFFWSAFHVKYLICTSRFDFQRDASSRIRIIYLLQMPILMVIDIRLAKSPDSASCKVHVVSQELCHKHADDIKSVYSNIRNVFPSHSVSLHFLLLPTEDKCPTHHQSGF